MVLRRIKNVIGVIFLERLIQQQQQRLGRTQIPPLFNPTYLPNFPIRSYPRILHQFSMATIANYHKICWLKQPTFILL